MEIGVDQEPIIGAIRELVILLKERAQNPDMVPEVLAMLEYLEAINLTTYNNMFNSGINAHNALDAEKVSRLASDLSNLVVYAKVPLSQMDGIVSMYASGLTHSLGNSLSANFAYEIQRQMQLGLFSVSGDNVDSESSGNDDEAVVTQNLSPAMVEVIKRLDPDKIKGSDEVLLDLSHVIQYIIRENKMLTDGLIYTYNVEFGAHQIRAGALSPAEVIFLHQYRKSRNPNYRSQYKEYLSARFKFDNGWKRDLLQKLALYVWIHHPGKTLDYDEYMELVDSESFHGENTPVSEQPLSLLASMLMMDDIGHDQSKYRGLRSGRNIRRDYNAAVKLTYS